MQEADGSHVSCVDLKAESGANSDHEPSLVVDSATSDCLAGSSQTGSEALACSQKDLHASDQNMTTSESISTVDLAGGEPASLGDGPADDIVYDMPVEEKNAVEDISTQSTVCADISSAVSHMDIDVSEEVARDSTISAGMLTRSLFDTWTDW